MTPEERAQLAPYVTSLDSPIFALKNLPEEVVAVLFAYYSRSREPLRANLLRLLQDQDLAIVPGVEGEDENDLLSARSKAREFHEKWVVGYGHASVAEHAVAHIAVEDVSIVVSKVIEDCRLAAYTEKSTRYIEFPRAYAPLDDLPEAARADYRRAVEQLFDTYQELLPEVTEVIAATADRSRFKTDRGFQNSCKAQACDTLRYLLPAGCHTNIGITANARTLEHMISKLLSHPLAEARQVGEQICIEATRLIPTLIKYARSKVYWQSTPGRVRDLMPELGAPTGDGGAVRFLATAPDAESTLAAAILYEQTGHPLLQVRAEVDRRGGDYARKVIHAYLDGRQRYGTEEHGYTDPPMRALEHLYYTTEIVVDYGAYRDIQRHRMATQTTQRLGCDLGYEVPPLIEGSRFEERYRSALAVAETAWRGIADDFPEEAQYVVPLAYRKRVLFTWNLRELHHFISLRSARQGHPSYRRVAQDVWREFERIEPFLASFIRVDLDDHEMARPG